MRRRIHNLAASAAGRSLAWAALVVLLGGVAPAALALNADGPVSPPLSAAPSTQMLNPQPGLGLPLMVVDERPDPLNAAAPGAWRVFGSQLDLALGAGCNLASSVYFGKRLPLLEALQKGDVPGLSDLGLLGLRGNGGGHVLLQGRAVQEKLSYSSGALQLQGLYVDVDKDFSVPGGRSVSLVGDRAAADVLAALRGTRRMQLQAQYAPSSALALSMTRDLTSVTNGNSTVDTATTQLHLEHKGALGFAADWMDRSRSDGGSENLMQFALNSVVGAGRSRTALQGVYKQSSQGKGAQQVDTLYQLGLAMAANPRAQFNLNYESLDQQGPQANHQWVRTRVGLASQLNRWAKLTAELARESDRQVRTRSDGGVKLELNPGRMQLTSGITTRQRQGQPDLAMAFGDLQVRLGRRLTDWAKAASALDPIPGSGNYGYRQIPGWAALGDGAVAVSCMGSSSDGKERVLTRSVGWQTMLSRRAYLKLALHENPMLKQDDKLVLQESRLQVCEGGFDVSRGLVALGRMMREQAAGGGGAQRTEVLALQGAVGRGDRLKLTGGMQSLTPAGGAAANWRFANINLKLGRQLADWAKAASDGGVFDDNTKYGHRKLPAWAAFGDGGLSLQYMGRQTDDGKNLIASAAGYQTMLGRRSYARLSRQRNPLTDRGQVAAVDRRLLEVGRRCGGKFLVLARCTAEDSLEAPKSLRTSLLGLRSRLSARERLEAMIVLDDVTSPGSRCRTATYGLEYAREADEGHYLSIKGTISRGDAPGGVANGPTAFQVDLAYKKAI